ncbi:MAG: LytR/AlgR family response regulator transcription factor [Lachnospiraceae bacterium]
MVNIAICDDKEQEVDILYDIIYKRFMEYNVPFKIIKCSNGEDLLYELKEVGDFDLILLDIELGVDNGIETAEKIRKQNPYCYIIFVSGYKQYYKAAFRVQPYQFLDKPIDQSEVEEVIDSVSNLIIDNNHVFSFEYKWKQYRILLNDILYFISDHRMVVLQTKDGATYEFYGKLNEVEEQIKQMSSVFLRVHKSYLINMNHIKIFQSEDVVMQDDALFPISIRRRKDVMGQYMSYVSR